MKLGFISDIHGNLPALEAVREALAREKVDRIVCGGDLVNPFLTSKETWEFLKQERIPTVRGNHEDYIAAYYEPSRNAAVATSVQFRPVQIVARHLGQAIAAELGALPFELTLEGPGGDDVFVCHASPFSNTRSYIRPNDTEVMSSLGRVREKLLLAGHIHEQWQGQREDKLLVVAGSVGLPTHGEPRAQFAIAMHRQGRWEAELRTVDYDVEAALKGYRESGCLELGGPIAWVIYEELRTGSRRLSEFIPWARPQIADPTDQEAWAGLAREYLAQRQAWNHLRQWVTR